MTQQRGFTLIELLVTIGILAVLATVVVLVINPAELFRQARDSQRISDLGTLNKAIQLYLVVAASPNLGHNVQNNCSSGDCTCDAYFWASASGANDGAQFPAIPTQTPNTGRGIDGTGWVPINFTDGFSFSGGSPLAQLPIDPINDTASSDPFAELVYKYRCSRGGSGVVGVFYEINANMESVRYSTGGSNDVESNSKDGGNINEIYEIGNEPGLDFT